MVDQRRHLQTHYMQIKLNLHTKDRQKLLSYIENPTGLKDQKHMAVFVYVLNLDIKP